jgi:hypothetical protein
MFTVFLTDTTFTFLQNKYSNLFLFETVKKINSPLLTY